jgi:hypothetical protein
MNEQQFLEMDDRERDAVYLAAGRAKGVIE